MYLSLIILVTSPFLLVETEQLETVYQWRYVDYTWPSKETRQEAIRTGDYNISEPLPMDLAVSQDGRVFMTMSSVTGVPARLGVITNKTEAESGPLIQPYPSWNWTAKRSCDAILKPLRMEIDRCNRLWVMDSSDAPRGEKRQCHPKLLAFDLWTDDLIYNIELPENIATNARTNLSLMANVKVETYGQYCEDTTVYMADALGNGLIIWDGLRLYRIEDPTFNPQPEVTTFIIKSDSAFDTTNMSVGIIGMDISPRVLPNEQQFLYYRPMASLGLYAISIDQLKKGTKGTQGEAIIVQAANNVLNSQSVVHAFSSEGILFLTSVKDMSLICWNRYRTLSKQNMVTIARDRTRLDYINAMHIIRPNIFGEEELWMLSNRLVRHNNRNVWNPKEINYRILRSPVEQLIAGTPCKLSYMSYP